MMKTTNFYKTAMGLLLWMATVSYMSKTTGSDALPPALETG